MDIVEQLRKSANTIYSQDGYTFRLGLQNEAADEIERLRDEVHFDVHTINALSETNDLLEAENKRLRELLQQWLGNCFVDTHGQGVTFGMGVKKVWAETRAALKGNE